MKTPRIQLIIMIGSVSLLLALACTSSITISDNTAPFPSGGVIAHARFAIPPPAGPG